MDMSTLKEFITPENIEKGVNLITGAGVTKVLKSSKTFNNIWDITIGNRLDAWNQKSIFKNQQDVEKYKNECIEKISKIPEDKIQDPKLSIIGPALEASKFYIEEEEIRNMFANLIAASMNSDFNNSIHHSFIEIIKQLSPHDAILFNSFPEKFKLRSIDKSSTTIQSSPNDNHIRSYYQFTKGDFNDPIKNSISFYNLKRLGLIDFYEDTALIESNGYSISIEDNNSSEIIPISSGLTIRTFCYITELGKAFKKVCCK